MIRYSTALKNRIATAICRAVGSNGVMVFYSGTAPVCFDDPATGERVFTQHLEEADVRALCAGHEPVMPEGAGWWRVMDNGGLVMMQGDDRE